MRLTVCVSRWWTGWDSLREQEKLEARKMLVSRDESHQSAARFVRRFLLRQTRWLEKDDVANMTRFYTKLYF